MKELLIIGGDGRMGRLFRSMLERRVESVRVLEKNDSIDENAISTADIVLVAVPMHLAVETIDKVAPLVKADSLLCDINSLKTEICAIYRSQCKAETLGLHPMFGPTVASFQGQKIVACPIKGGDKARWLLEQLDKLGAEIVETTPEEHDKAMAVVQVLTHFGMMVMGRALSKCGMELKDTLRFMSPIYRLEASMIGRLFAQDPDLYREIITSNPAGAELREQYQLAAKELESLIDDGNAKEFNKTFREIASYFEDFSDEAMSLSDEIIDTIMSR